MSQENVDAVRTVYEEWGHGTSRPVWTFRGRAVIRLEDFRDRAQALEAVGLSA